MLAKNIMYQKKAHEVIAFLMSGTGVALVVLCTIRYGIAGLICSTLGLFSFIALMIELDKGLGAILKKEGETFSFQVIDGKTMFSFLIKKSLRKEEKRALKKRLHSLCTESVILLQQWEDLSSLYSGLSIVEIAQVHRIKFEAEFLRQLKELIEVAENATFNNSYNNDQLNETADYYYGCLTKRLDEMSETVRTFKSHFMLLSFKLEMGN